MRLSSREAHRDPDVEPLFRDVSGLQGPDEEETAAYPGLGPDIGLGD